MAFLQLVIFGESQQKQQDGHQEHDNRLRPGTRPGGPGGREATEMGAPGPEVPGGTGESTQAPRRPPMGQLLSGRGPVEEHGPARQRLGFQGEPKNWFFL